MQKLDIRTVSVGSMVTVNRNGKVYTAKVIRLPLIDKNGKFADGFRPQQFKLEVLGNDEWAGNRYVSYTAVHTAEADKAQKQRAKAEAEAKAQRAEERKAKVAAKSLDKASDLELLKVLADRLGYSVIAK